MVVSIGVGSGVFVGGSGWSGDVSEDGVDVGESVESEKSGAGEFLWLFESVGVIRVGRVRVIRFGRLSALSSRARVCCEVIDDSRDIVVERGSRVDFEDARARRKSIPL